MASFVKQTNKKTSTSAATARKGLFSWYRNDFHSERVHSISTKSSLYHKNSPPGPHHHPPPPLTHNQTNKQNLFLWTNTHNWFSLRCLSKCSTHTRKVVATVIFQRGLVKELYYSTGQWYGIRFLSAYFITTAVSSSQFKVSSITWGLSCSKSRI